MKIAKKFMALALAAVLSVGCAFVSAQTEVVLRMLR